MNSYLEHHGIKGQHWGLRRFQNEDGSYTAEGKERYKKGSESTLNKIENIREKSRKRGPTPESRDRFRRKPSEDVIDKIQNIGKNPRKSGIAGGIGGKSGGVYDRGDGTKDMKRLEKDAKKDAEDMARAKAYYGEGAGNRRKQIRNRISERMKDPDYKKSYEKHMSEQNMAEHQKAANRERKVQDTKDRAAKIGRGIKNFLLGAGTTSIAAIAIVNAARMTGADKKIAEFGKKAINDIGNKVRSMKKPKTSDYNWQANRRSNPSNNYSSNNRSSDRGSSGSKQNRPWIDDQGNIHFK